MAHDACTNTAHPSIYCI